MSVASFKPENGQALENIPHMLRYWASLIESGECVASTAVLVLLAPGARLPDFGVFGSPQGEAPHPLVLAGMLDACRHQLMETLLMMESEGA